MQKRSMWNEGISRVGSILFILFFFTTSVFMFLIALLLKVVTALFDRRLVVLHWFSSLWASMYIWTMPAWKVKIHGREKIDRDKTYVLVSNHQSMVDILAGFRMFIHFKWVAKVELLKVPFVGWNMWLNKYVILKRGDRQSTLDMMRACEEHLSQGSSVYIYPEGTRSKSGEIAPFKSGAFALAKRNGVSVLPIAVAGSKDALPKNSLTIRGWHQIDVVILDEIPAEQVKESNPRELADHVRAQIKDVIDAYQKPENAPLSITE